MVAAIDEVMRIRPPPRGAISRAASLARCTTDTHFRSTRRSSVRRSVWVTSPPEPILALMETDSGWRPPAVAAFHSRSTPSHVARSACTLSTVAPSAWMSCAARATPASSAAITRSYPWSANCLASSYPMPLDAPVTTATGRSGLEEDLDCSIFFLLEVLVHSGGVVQRYPMGREGLHAQRVGGAQDRRHDVVQPVPYVGLAHAQLHLLVEQHHHRHRIGHAAVDAGQRDRAAAPHHVDGQVEGGQ